MISGNIVHLCTLCGAQPLHDLFHGFQVGASSLGGVVVRRNSFDAALFLPAFRYSPYRMRNVD
ncbi:hypothetical protein T09_14932 [Trichinella sp. T9]|nr:hypothetical protein T09_14932 [Trichinella sp. T9]